MKKIFTCYWTRKVGILFFVVVLLMMAGMVGVGLLNAQKGSKPEQQEQEHPEQKQSVQKQVSVAEAEELPRFKSDTAPEDCLIFWAGKCGFYQPEYL